MLTPISTASTATGPAGATRGSNNSVAGRLLTTLASTAAIAAIASKAARPEPDGSTADIARSIPLSMTARTTTRTASTEAPHSATQAGASPTDWATANPASVSATTTNTNTGGRGGAPSRSGSGCTRRSSAKNHRKIR